MRCKVTVEGSRPAAGVGISDGAQMTLTDHDGFAEIDPGDQPFVWVRRPNGHDCESWFRRASDGEAVFDLVPTEQSLPLTFAQITDLHVSALPELASMPQPDSLIGLDADGQLALKPLTRPVHLRALLDQLDRAEGPSGGPAFVVATGDLTDRGTDDDYACLSEALVDTPMPVHLLPGNHDHYGHRHDLSGEDQGEGNAAGLGTASTGRYETNVGPRWWSMDHTGLHLVALDWFSHRLGIDTELQERWLVADLSTTAPDTPVLMLTHDQMSTRFYEWLGEVAPHVRVLGSLSGHWHTSRVLRHGDQIHANTGNATFGGFDWTPAHSRLVSFDGSGLELHTIVPGSDPQLARATFRSAGGPGRRTEHSRWSTRLPGAVHRTSPVPVEHSVVVAWSDDDEARGGISSYRLEDGVPQWSVDLDGPVRATPSVAPDGRTLLVVSVGGGVTAIDGSDGTVLWGAQVGDRLRIRIHAAPVVTDRCVIVGEVDHLVALDLADGALRWQREDLEQAEAMISAMQGVVQGGVAVFGFSFMDNHTFGLDLQSGRTLWQRDGNRLNAPGSDIVADLDTSDVFLTRTGGVVERLDSLTGEPRWNAQVRATFVPGRPLLVDEALYVTSGIGEVHRLDAGTGEIAWRCQLPGGRLLPMGPYRRDGLAVVSGPVLAHGDLVQTSGDGQVHRIDPDTGTVKGSITVGVPITSPALPVGRDVLVATAEGSLVRLEL